ncbi:alpha/beta hydrolase [Phenylobacterium sp.]|jgi:predicted alpha/beta superfamily hydrolase|uniref:alpha/beta hydrolase n=1 Tax=Phenylobacterium sp. TaxID=1871053 RepID=UPI002E351DF8|nr:alpha/beta hydrolase-fold protein [Phenylobacterium sp.]HEX3367075.1 alpha/beta hydrolase-fold protein [Phenylobacterium sp.]
MRRLLAMGLAMFVAAAVHEAAFGEPLKVVSEGPVTESSATRFLLHADRLGRDFEVVVYVPRATVFLPGQKLPAIYALDGGYGLAGLQSLFLSARDFMAPAIVVSIDYVSGQQNFRATDFTHNPFTVAGTTAGGGGAAFEAFLLQDLKPFIEARYPADPAGSVLFGHSLGAVFAANVFTDRPDAFSGYIIGSLVVPRDPTIVGRVAKAAKAAHGVRVFLAVGGDEDGTTAENRMMRQGFASMAEALKNQPGITLEARSYPGDVHLSYYPKLILDGFRFVLPPTVPVNLAFAILPASTIARYEGVYDMPDGRTITVKGARDSMLTAEISGTAPVFLLPNGPDRYYAYTSDLDVLFDANGMTLVGHGNAKLRAGREKAP